MKRAKRLARWLGRLALVGAALVVATVVLLRFVDPPTTAFMLAHQLRGAPKGRPVKLRGAGGRPELQHRWVPLDDIAPALQLAVVASEDQKFPTHFGFDVDAIADAVEARFEGTSTRGASTLTQQVAKNLFLWAGPSFFRKALEAPLALLLELVWPKRRILEVYLNVAEFADGVYGVEAACRAAYGKPAAKVTLEEAALLAAVLPAPKRRSVQRPDAVTQARAAWVLEQVPKLGPDWLAPLSR